LPIGASRRQAPDKQIKFIKKLYKRGISPHEVPILDAVLSPSGLIYEFIALFICITCPRSTKKLRLAAANGHKLIPKGAL
jgi:hypothetical protein